MAAASALQFQMRAEFGPFLFASVSNDAEAPLSVVSALARLDIDPWQEAFYLSHLGTDAAARRLSGLLDQSAGSGGSRPDLNLAAERLVALLPPPGRSAPAKARAWIGARIALDRHVSLLLLIVAMGLMVALLNLTDTARRRTPAGHPLAPSAVASPVPRPTAPPR